MKIYVDWEEEIILTEKKYQQEMEKQKNPKTMDWVGFEEWVKDNFNVSELLDLMYDGANVLDRLASQWASYVMEETYCKVVLADD